MKKTFQSGYVGMIALLIGVAIIAILSVKVFNSSFGKGPATTTNPQGLTPIEQAEAAKTQLEKSSVDAGVLLNILPKTIYPGDPVLITIDSKTAPTSVSWDTKVIPVFTYEGKYRALLPIVFEEKVLKHTLAVNYKDREIKREVIITPRPKIERPLGIPEKLGGNTSEAATSLVNNLAAENKILNTVKTEPKILWSKAFAYPVFNVYITDDYGYSRATVDQTITHKGTDFRAPIGTEVRAMNRGVVRLARTFTVYGNAVVIDHGLGVQTLYMHLSKLNVKEGQTVEKGELLGLSGDTGYVEAAHLHISVKINGISIDPMTFLKFFL
jgi:murein DD-endopeptidase MepM/ murein hydrolase activator NlpD